MAQMPETIILRKAEETKTGVTYCMADVKTNADCIRAMTDEELARWIATTADDNCPDTAHERYCDNRCGECWLDWLKSPVKDG